ncbi:MAG: hypothetical protein JWL90_2110 [Chthoniobacteraceae bacterium]|nr:hypothetical protein [Chthoniobacteraceae bacterium]
MILQLNELGYATVSTSVSQQTIAALRDRLFKPGKAGTRCLLDDPIVRDVALKLKGELARASLLSPAAVAVHAIAFDKTAEVNWNVAWHQDLIFPFAHPVSAPGFTVPCVKAGIDFARPPLAVLEEMLAVRVHLDACNENNGPLRISPGTHAIGLIETFRIADQVSTHGEVPCLAGEGEALLMRPLLLHASSKANVPAHRRVLHVVYHSGTPISEKWHRALG